MSNNKPNITFWATTKSVATTTVGAINTVVTIASDALDSAQKEFNLFKEELDLSQAIRAADKTRLLEVRTRLLGEQDSRIDSAFELFKQRFNIGSKANVKTKVIVKRFWDEVLVHYKDEAFIPELQARILAHCGENDFNSLIS